DGRLRVQPDRGPDPRQRPWLRHRVRDRRHVPRPGVHPHSRHDSADSSAATPMKITDVRTRVVEWRGPTVPPAPHFCTNPMDLLSLPADSMAGFRFHGWVIVEIFPRAGPRGSGKAR